LLFFPKTGAKHTCKEGVFFVTNYN